MKMTKIIITLAAAMIISACESEPDTNLQDSIVETTPSTDGAVNPSAKFDPSNSIIPFPNNLLFGGSEDGTINVPGIDETNLADPQVALSALDGFSTVSPMSAGFSTTIDAESINPDSVKIYDVTLSGTGGAVVAVNEELSFGVDFVATLSSVDSSQSTLAILPLKPLDEKTSYMVVITDDLKTSDGTAFGPSITYRLIKTLTESLTAEGAVLPGALRSITDEDLAKFEGIRQIVNISEGTVAAYDADIETSDIILSWSFTTQSIGDVLEQVREDIHEGDVPASVLVDSQIDSALTGMEGYPGADIFVGTLDVPYYLTAASSVNDPTPLASFWKGEGGSKLSRYNTAAKLTSTQSIPLMASIPKTTMPDDGYPVVIFQHGITSNRATMLALADAFAKAGMAVLAIDMPMHGLTGNETDGTEGFYQAAGASERTFDLDLVTQDPLTGDITAAGPDGVTDTSGRHFINLSNLQNTRDNLRQAVSDLFTLTYAVQGMTAGTSTFDASRIYFLGHSLGAIVGTTFVALEENVRDAVMAFGGGSVAKILDGSAAFSPSIVSGLATLGVNKGTADYESFMAVTQTVMDTADPINYAEKAAEGRGLLYFEIVGGSTSPSDLVVPNTVPDSNDSGNTVPAPLAGTEPVIKLMGLEQVSTDTTGEDLLHSVKFLVGNHSSLLSAAADSFNSADTNAAVRAEIQGIAATFLATDGAMVNITDDTLIQVPPQ